ncbi:hypothetical protein MTO96_045618 [Rhipicephalus appendiculatus]
MLVDTAAVVSLMSLRDCKHFFSHIKLFQSHLVLLDYSKQAICNSGYFQANVCYHGVSALVKFYVAERCTSLIGLNAIQALKIIIVGETLSCALAEPSVQLPNATLEPGRLFAPDPGQVEDSVH